MDTPEAKTEPQVPQFTVNLDASFVEAISTNARKAALLDAIQAGVATCHTPQQLCDLLVLMIFRSQWLLTPGYGLTADEFPLLASLNPATPATPATKDSPNVGYS